MQCANELLCVLNVTVQAFHLLCQPHQAFSLLDILSLDLQEPEMLEKLLPSIQWHVPTAPMIQVLHNVSNPRLQLQSSILLG